MYTCEKRSQTFRKATTSTICSMQRHHHPQCAHSHFPLLSSQQTLSRSLLCPSRSRAASCYAGKIHSLSLSPHLSLSLSLFLSLSWHTAWISLSICKPSMFWFFVVCCSHSMTMCGTLSCCVTLRVLNCRRRSDGFCGGRAAIYAALKMCCVHALCKYAMLLLEICVNALQSEGHQGAKYVHWRARKSHLQRATHSPGFPVDTRQRDLVRCGK